MQRLALVADGYTRPHVLELSSSATHLEHQALLRVQDRRLGGADAVRRSIKVLRTLQEPATRAKGVHTSACESQHMLPWEDMQGDNI